MTTSKWVCGNGHVWTSPQRMTWCPYPKCQGEPKCVAGPLKPKKEPK